LRVVSSPVWGRCAAYHEMVAGSLPQDSRKSCVPRRHHEDFQKPNTRAWPGKPSPWPGGPKKCRALHRSSWCRRLGRRSPAIEEQEECVSCDGNIHRGWLRSASPMGSAWPSFEINGQERSGPLRPPERRHAHQCFPRSRLKKLRFFRCNCDRDMPAPTIGVVVGAACALPASRVGTDACN
jgi:hypothetical protein